jgi:hypothetical protein
MNHFKKQPRIYSNFHRNGPNHRSGADVSFGDIVKIFGFKTATVGAWVTKEEQQIAANLFFDALCDLMTILRVPEKVISLNGTLSIAFGKGGQKHASAHYNSASRTLALAKNAGAGALSHEWFHSYDHFITSKFIKSSALNEFASAVWLDNREISQHPINTMLEDCFESIFLDPNNKKQLSKLFVDSAAADKSLNTFYFSRPQEVCARAFEAFIQDNSLKNEFLVQGTKQSEEAKMGVYPQGDQRVLICGYFARYFTSLGLALERQHSQKN